jgi:hypothetical protein
MATLAKGADLGPSSSTIVANPSDVLAANLGPEKGGPQVPSTPDRIPLGAVTRLGKEAKD